MGKVIINEFQRTANDGSTPAAGPRLGTKAVEIGAASAQSAVLSSGTTFVRIFAEADCSIVIGPDPTATADEGIPLAAGQFDYLAVDRGDKVAVIGRTVA